MRTTRLYRDTFIERHGNDSVALHDTLAVLEAVVPETVSTTLFPLAVACSHGAERGVTVIDRRTETSGPPVAATLDADVAAVTAEVGRRIRALG